MSANQRVIITNDEDDILDPEYSPAGKSRMGDWVITRDSNGYMTVIQITEGTTIRTLTITRDSNNRIITITEIVT